MSQSGVYRVMPNGFSPKMVVVACFCERHGKFLLLKRRHDKPQPNKWCLPGGKINGRETPWGAVVREIREETGVVVILSQLRFVHTLYVQYEDADFVYHVFRAGFFPEMIKIQSKEHSEYEWVSLGEAFIKDLIEGEAENIKLAYKL